MATKPKSRRGASLASWRGRGRVGLSGAAMGVIALVVAGTAGMVLYDQTLANQKPLYYVAYVTDEKLDQTTSYNTVNIFKDGLLMGGLTLGAAACTTGTFGTCAAAAIPGVSSLLGGMLNDPIITTGADFSFTNSGNGTASDVTYIVATYVDGSLVKTDTYTISSIAPGNTDDIHNTYTVTLSEIPTAIWNAIQGKGNVDIEVANMTYGGGA